MCSINLQGPLIFESEGLQLQCLLKLHPRLVYFWLHAHVLGYVTVIFVKGKNAVLNLKKTNYTCL